jgi:hypothetical protein
VPPDDTPSRLGAPGPRPHAREVQQPGRAVGFVPMWPGRSGALLASSAPLVLDIPIGRIGASR